MTTGKYKTEHGQGIRTATGWGWVCDYCHLSTFIHMGNDVEGFDVQRWLDGIDAAHSCEHGELREQD